MNAKLLTSLAISLSSVIATGSNASAAYSLGTHFKCHFKNAPEILVLIDGGPLDASEFSTSRTEAVVSVGKSGQLQKFKSTLFQYPANTRISNGWTFQAQLSPNESVDIKWVTYSDYGNPPSVKGYFNHFGKSDLLDCDY